MSIFDAIGMETWHEDGHACGRLPVASWLLGPSGSLRISALATLVDVIVGIPPTGAVNPTTDLVVTWLARPPVGAMVRGDVTILQHGRRLIVGEAPVVEEATGDVVAWSSATFVNRVVAGDVDYATPRHWGGPADPHLPLVTSLGIVPVGAGAAELDMDPRVVNPVAGGTIQGGIQAVLAEVAAETVLGDGHWVSHLAIRFLSAARVGPVRATATALPGDGTQRTARVEIRDTGNGDRLVSHAMTVVEPVEGP